MKKTYEIPEMEIVCAETEDVIRTSTLTDGGAGDPSRNDSYDVSSSGQWGN